MLQIRRGVFETNSSSTHSITMCTASEFEKFKDGEVYLNEGYWRGIFNDNKDKKFLTKEEAVQLMNEHYIKYGEETCDDYRDSHLAEYGIYSYDEKINNCWLEDYEEHYFTPSGEEIVAFGVYGHD